MLRLLVLLRVEVQQGFEQREYHRTENDAERAEERQPAENAEEKKQNREAEPIADEQGLQNIIHRADDPQGPGEQHDCPYGFTLQKQIDRCRDRHQRRAANR